MKIRTDFVTNSSSSSFVTYNLKDSEFCKFVYEKMQEKGLDYNSWSDYRPASRFDFDEDSIYAYISCGDEGLYCERYAPECIEPEYPDFEFELYYILRDCAEKYYDKLDDEIKKKIESCDELSEWANDISLAFFDEYSETDDNYRYSWLIEKSENSDTEAVYKVFEASAEDENITKEDDCFVYSKMLEDEKLYLKSYPDKLILLTNYEKYPEYGGWEKESDIKDMTKKFIDMIGEFLPLDEIDADEEELRQLFEKDKANGNFDCDVCMDCTD